MIGDTEEKLVQAAQVAANGGQKKVDSRAKNLDFKDQQREARRKQRLLEKGY